MGTLTLGSTPTTGDIRDDIALGLLPGFLDVNILGTNPQVTGTDVEETLWDGGGLYEFPTAPETWEILSDSTDDVDTTGDGAHLVLISSLDADYKRQQNFVPLNGTTPVAIPGTHIRTESIFVILAGGDFVSNPSNSNIGTLTLRRTSDSLLRSLIPAMQGLTYNSMYTVPAGRSAYVTGASFTTAQGQDIKIINNNRFFGSATIKVFTFSQFEQPFYLPIDAYSVLPEKTDCWLNASRTSGTGNNALVASLTTFREFDTPII